MGLLIALIAELFDEHRGVGQLDPGVAGSHDTQGREP
jgi:hypothetical protein